MATLTEKIAGAKGSDIYTAGTYKVSDGTLLYPIFAAEYAGATATLTSVKDNGGQYLTQKFVDGAGIAITSDMGQMTFTEDVYEFTTDATIKVWYS